MKRIVICAGMGAGGVGRRGPPSRRSSARRSKARSATGPAACCRASRSKRAARRWPASRPRSRDSKGVYRFPALRPGRYEITATLQGFQPAKSVGRPARAGPDPEDRSGDAASARVTETVKVTGDSPLIDVKQNSAGANVQAEIIERIPEGPRLRDARHVGARHHQRGPQSRHPDRRRERRRQPVPHRRRGHDEPAERHVGQGAAAGLRRHRAGEGQRLRGRVPRLDRRRDQRDHEVGRQQYHGSAGIYFTNDALQGDVRQTLRLSPTNQTIAEYVTTPLDDYSSPEPIFDLGGPILKDRLWFFAGYDPSWTNRTRTVLFSSNRDRRHVQPEADSVNLLNYNVTGQIARNLRGRFAASNQRDKGGYALPASGPHGVSTAEPGALPVGHPPRLVERLVLRRRRLGREQQDLRQRHGDALQGRPARRRHVQRRAAPHVPGVELLTRAAPVRPAARFPISRRACSR